MTWWEMVQGVCVGCKCTPCVCPTPIEHGRTWLCECGGRFRASMALQLMAHQNTKQHRLWRERREEGS